MSLNPDLADPSNWEENPLKVACLYGSRRVAERIAADHPKFLRAKDQDGQIPLHVACSKGDLHSVQLFVKLDPKLCLKKDRFLWIPLQLAVQGGFVEVVKALVRACPRSIQAATSSGETVFHLAVKNNQSETFCELLQLALQLSEQNLLHRKDRQGDSVLHIAVSNKLAEVIVKLLDAQNSTGKALVRVNTLNKNRQTALDVYNQSNNTILTQNIGRILKDAGGLEAGSLTARARIRRNLETKNVTLVALSVMTGAAFTTVCNLPSSFTIEGDLEFSARDVIAAQLPPVFYLMVFNSAVLVVCLVAIGLLLWSLPLQPVIVFSTLAIGIVYAILVKNVMPKMSVRAGNCSIQGSALVGLLALGCVCLGAILYYGFKVFKWAVSKTAQELISV